MSRDPPFERERMVRVGTHRPGFPADHDAREEVLLARGLQAANARFHGRRNDVPRLLVNHRFDWRALEAHRGHERADRIPRIAIRNGALPVLPFAYVRGTRTLGEKRSIGSFRGWPGVGALW